MESAPISNPTFTEAGSEQISQGVPHVECDNVNTTCFVESGDVIRPNYSTSVMPSFIKPALTDIKTFMERPQLIESVLWTSSNTLNSTINNGGAGRSVQADLLANAAWLNKLEGYNLFRATYNVRVQFNAYPFQQGRLLAHYLPNYAQGVAIEPGRAKRTNGLLSQKIQHPHVEIDCRGTADILPIPWIAPAPYWDKKAQTFDWGTYFIDVMSPLAYGTVGTSAASVEVTIWGYWTDIELAAPCLSQVNSSSELSMPKISDILRITSKIAGSLSDVPSLTAIATPVSWAANALAGIAAHFGWSKPLLNVEPHIICKQKNRYYSTADGPNPAVPLALICDNELARVDNYQLDKNDQMSMAFLRSVPSYVINSGSNWGWGAASATGTNIYQAFISPTSNNLREVGTVSNGGHTFTYHCMSPTSYLASRFNYWRGSYNVTLKFVKTVYHTGRLMVVFTPYKNVTSVPTVSTGFLSLRHIIDVHEQDEVTFNLPYLRSDPWLTTGQSTGAFDPGNSSGRLDILIVNPLRAPDNCSQIIDMLVFFNPGDDFELAGPNQIANNYGLYPGPFSPQMATTSILVRAGIGNAIIDKASLEPDKLCMGERFSSIKQLISRTSTLFPINTANPGSASQGLLMYPWFMGSITDNSGVAKCVNYIGDNFSTYGCMYQYFRGGVTLGYIKTSDDLYVSANVPIAYSNKQSSVGDGEPVYAVAPGAYASSGVDSAAPGLPLANPSIAPNVSFNYHSDKQDPVVLNHIPYYNYYPITIGFLQTFTSGADFRTNQSIPQSSWLLETSATNFPSCHLQRSMADDFQLLFFIGAPPQLVSVV